MFETFYASHWQHPGLLWAAGAVGLAIALACPGRSPSTYRAAIGLTGLAAVDAWLTTGDVLGLGALPPIVAMLVAVFFVIAGDFRYLALREWGAQDGSIRPSLRGGALALALAFAVPLAAQIIVVLLSDERVRVLFLTHEITFLLLVLGRRWLRTRRGRVRQLAGWTSSLDWPVLAWYGMWAVADLIILTLGDLGFLIRVVPNALYYGAFPFWLVWCAPRKPGDKASQPRNVIPPSCSGQNRELGLREMK